MDQSAQHAVSEIATPGAQAPAGSLRVVPRLKSKDLFQRMREIEIEHEGRIYRLRVTQLNKLILTA